MNAKIYQLCKKIAEHPSQINLLNQAISIALSPPSLPDLLQIVELISKLPRQSGLSSFISAKLRVIFLSLIEFLQKEDEQAEAVQQLSKIYRLSSQKSQLSLEVVNYLCEKDLSWHGSWSGQLLAGICEQMIKNINSKNANWQRYIGFLLTLPQYSQLIISSQHQMLFKKSYQKFLLTILDSKQCPQELIQKVYHELGTKIISKMQQPLALSHHCLEVFNRQKNPQLQIEVLSCLFVLVGKYGLQLEHFYQKLQQLILYREQSRSVYELPNSRRFFKLLEASLKSSRVPFKTISKIAHIMVRQLPGESGQFAFWSLSFLVNLIKKHRKLIDQLPLLPEIKALKYHYNPKIRSLIGEISKNLNKVDYLDIQEFTKISIKGVAKKKLESALSSLQDQQLQFRLPAFEQAL